MTTLACDRCGAPEEPGLIACKFCHAVFAHEPPHGEAPSHAGEHRILLDRTVCRVRHGHVSRRTHATLMTDCILFEGGSPTHVSHDELLGTREDTSFNSEWISGYPWLILRTRDQEVGLLMKTEDHRAWVEALAGLGKGA